MLAATMSSNQGKNLRLWKVKQQGQMAGKSPSQEDWWFLESGLPVFPPRSPRKGCCISCFSHCCDKTPDRSKLGKKKVYVCSQWAHHVREGMAAGLILEDAAQCRWYQSLGFWSHCLHSQEAAGWMNAGVQLALSFVFSLESQTME